MHNIRTSVTKITMTETLAQERIQNELHKPFELTQGLKQGDGLAPLLLSLIHI